ncbi:MAG: hypothetical protein NC098_08150 [Lachnoclostridium sp.]|nr:hypothetical protein [Lachnoclostridium sp.]
MLIAFISMKAWAEFEVDSSDNLRIWLEFPNPVIADGKTVNYLKVYQHDDDDLEYTAFNMEIILPEGFKLNMVKKGRDTVEDIEYSDRATSTHSIACNIVGGVDLKVIGTSSQNADFYKDDIEGNPLDLLFTVGLIAEPSISTGEYQVELKGVKFCHKDATARVPATEPQYFTMNVENPTTTGIEEIDADKIDPSDCYDILGRKVDITKVHNEVVVSKGRKYLVR